MAIRKHVKNLGNGQFERGQGYKDIMALKGDVADLKRLKQDKDDDVTKLRIGKACQAALTYFENKLPLICPNRKNIHVGSLKKNSRIWDKSVSYAVEFNQNEIVLENVRDILRATLIFDPSHIVANGNTLIDKVNRVFQNNLVQVKNRFIEAKFPKVPPAKASFNKEDVLDLYNHGLRGRDLLYRDLQFLIRIPRAACAAIAPFNHIFAEIQVTVPKLYEGKKSGGHGAYKLVRRVMEYCEFRYYWDGDAQKNRAPQRNYANASTHYENSVTNDDFKNFAGAINEGFDKYYKGTFLKEVCPKNLKNAIDNSVWYNS